MMRDGHRTKERITRSALRLFVEKGITEATVRDISQAAGVAEGTLYRHFASKEDLAWELFAGNFMAFARELEELARGEETFQAKLAAMVGRFCEFFDRDPLLFSYLLLAQHAQLHKVTEDMANPVTVVRELVAQGMAKGEVPPADPEVAAAMVLGVVLQVAVFKIYGRVRQDLAGLAPELTAACFRVLQVRG
jgi:AcrR family transcriptional regulator